MAFKFVAICAFLAVATAGILPLEHHQHAPLTVEHHHSLPIEHHTIPVEHHAPIYHSAPIAHVSAPAQNHVLFQKQHHDHEQYPDDPHPQYNFAYDVQDAISGDSKSQTESRDGDVVHGEYSLNDADGFRRTVKYTADPVNGFNAVVHREPLSHKIIAAAPAVPLQYHHTPTTIVKAPVSYSTIPAHRETQQNIYTTYETPAHSVHHDDPHLYQYHH